MLARSRARFARRVGWALSLTARAFMESWQYPAGAQTILEPDPRAHLGELVLAVSAPASHRNPALRLNCQLSGFSIKRWTLRRHHLLRHSPVRADRRGQTFVAVLHREQYNDRGSPGNVVGSWRRPAHDVVSLTRGLFRSHRLLYNGHVATR